MAKSDIVTKANAEAKNPQEAKRCILEGQVLYLWLPYAAFCADHLR
jgi:hypothetical protein